ncbi:MAG: hypothetical protein CO103_07335 [Chloroflexi bacterium CG_4_9_14_3_um_filter_45_9]|nr:MAG: hypothetical protein CO103_07335 [Chloroflexi bacterium CG_4_9_14_3_um_filter_45_9]
MSELKSAWEIALEKSNKLGKPSAEEEQRYLEEKYRQIGTAIVRKYLDDPRGSPESSSGLTSQLEAYSEKGKNPIIKNLIRRAALNELIAALDLKNPMNPNEICQGIASLRPESQPVLDQVTQLVQEYEQARGETRRELENKGKEVLHRLRISGTAVGDTNIEDSTEWQEKQQLLMATFAPKLDSLKQELTKG